MAYTKTFKQSPNYTPGAQTKSVWGVNRKIKEVCLHHWDDPKNKPSFNGVVNLLLNKARQASAHYVAEAGRVAQLVKEEDNAWANQKGNPYTISIECNPLARASDIKTIAELVADIRKRRGNLPLVPHSKYAATACPGAYKAKLKQISDMANAINKPKPKPAPPPPAKYKVVDEKGAQAGAYNEEKNAWDKFEDLKRKGKILDYATGKDLTKDFIKKFAPVVPPPVPAPPIDAPTEPAKEDPKPPEPDPPADDDTTQDSAAGEDRQGEPLSVLDRIVIGIIQAITKLFNLKGSK